MPNRIDCLRALLSYEGVDAFLIIRPENRYYLTGFTGSSGAVVINEKEIYLFTDFRYEEQAREQSPHCQLVIIKESMMEAIACLAFKENIHVLGCEGDFITLQQFNALQNKLNNRRVIPLQGIVERLRAIKDEFEISMIASSVALTDQAFNYVLPFVREGVSEKSLGLEIEFFIKKNGAEDIAFPLIVASGTRSSMPHGTASDKKLMAGDLVIIDFGSRLESYHSDLTRTVVIGDMYPRQEMIYNIVLEAQLAGIKAVRAGIPAFEVDKAARDVIENYGYGQYFGHSTGHGLGLQIHENPRLSSKDDTELKPGMTVTIEPGIYLPGWGGVRIEDTVVVKEKGYQVLSATAKDKLVVCGL